MEDDDKKQKVPVKAEIKNSENKPELIENSTLELDFLINNVADTTVVSSASKVNLDSLNTEVVKENIETEKGLIGLIIEFLQNPEKFLAMFFGGATETEKSENLNKWEKFDDPSILTFFEEIKETFSLTKENTNPEEFKEKYNYESKKGTKFREIMEFQKKSGEVYSPKSLMVLWANKDSLILEDKILKIKKNLEKFKKLI